MGSRGSQVFTFTYKDIAEAMQMAFSSIACSLSFRELIETRGISGVSGQIMRRKTKVSTPLAWTELEPLLAKKAHFWEDRFPRFDVYRCSEPECVAILLGPGNCWRHGGSATSRFGAKNYFELLVGPDWIPLHRLVVAPPPGMHVHHKDGNIWNNRPSNLEVLSPEAHFEHHRLK